jgi:hypothetical protein
VAWAQFSDSSPQDTKTILRGVFPLAGEVAVLLSDARRKPQPSPAGLRILGVLPPQSSPLAPAPAATAPSSSSSPPPMTREGTAQSPSPWRINSSPESTIAPHEAGLRHKAPPARSPTPTRPGPSRTPRARAQQQARRPRGEHGGERAARETSRVPGAGLGRGRLPGSAAWRGFPGWAKRSAPLRCSRGPRSAVWRERSRVAGEPEPAAGQPCCARTSLPEAAGLREAVTPAGRAGQSGARPSRRRDGTTGARARARVGDGQARRRRGVGQAPKCDFQRKCPFFKYSVSHILTREILALQCC